MRAKQKLIIFFEMKNFDCGYYLKKTKRKLKKITIKKKFIAWNKGKEFYDGKRSNGYGGFAYDGRWLSLLPKIIKRYNINKNSRVLEIGCKKGYLLNDLKKLLPGIKCFGVEDHIYPIKNSPPFVKKNIKLSRYDNLPFSNKSFDFIISISAIYSYNFGDLIKIFHEMNRVVKNKKNIYLSLAAYDKEQDLHKFLKWSTLSSVVLAKKDWMKFFKRIGYKGDYFFIDSEILGLK